MDAVLHALADESRRTVLEILRDHPASAGELAEVLPIARPGVSRHLLGMKGVENRAAGLVECPRVGGTIHAVFTSTWTGPGRIEVCDAPHHLLLTMEPGTDDESQMEAWLTEEGSKTRLVVEERGLPVDKLYFHGAGWQAHLEDLGRSLAEDTSAHPEPWTEQIPAPAWRRRWDELTPAYQAMGVE